MFDWCFFQRGRESPFLIFGRVGSCLTRSVGGF
jgi:hypothetical protein